MKKDQVILNLKDFFGATHTFEYSNFYEANKHLDVDSILNKYCELKCQKQQMP